MTRAVTLGLSVLLLTILAIRAQTMQIRERDPEWIAPAIASAKLNPLANRPEAAGGGQKLFSQRCSTCHSDDGRGSDRAPDLTASNVQAQSDGAPFWKISGGNTRGGMPGFSFLPEPQRWQLVMQLRVLGRGSVARWTPKAHQSGP